ncbi:MAG TPA: hypothetical protein VKZ75_08540 [Cyclobacteriaceae bacterium]|nr:hypothetical protein [Cyclobacteriaceae bacterium]
MENPKLYKGIEYVQLNELPEDQQRMIKESLNQELFIKILVDGRLHQDCILYKDYKYWFERAFNASVHEVKPGASAAAAGGIAPLNISIAKS